MLPLPASQSEAEGSLTPTQKLREKLSSFRFNDALTPSLRRSSPRTNIPTKRGNLEDVDSVLPPHPTLQDDQLKNLGESSHTFEDPPGPSSSASRPNKRARTALPVKRKNKVTIAPPEKYAHLNGLPDHLGEESDVLDGEDTHFVP